MDIIATVGNERIAIQCKNYAKPVSNKPVQEVYAGSRYHGCTTAWVVAPEGFTKGAVELARRVGVSLHGAHYLQACIQQRGRAEREKAEREEANSEPIIVNRDKSEHRMRNSTFKKHAVRVGSRDGSAGETITFAADLLGTVGINNNPGMYYTYYRLPDGTFRVLMEYKGTAMLVPSNMTEAISSGQRNNFSYGRMTLEEMKAHEYDFWPGYEGLMSKHPENVRDGPRDID